MKMSSELLLIDKDATFKDVTGADLESYGGLLALNVVSLLLIYSVPFHPTGFVPITRRLSPSWTGMWTVGVGSAGAGREAERSLS